MKENQGKSKGNPRENPRFSSFRSLFVTVSGPARRFEVEIYNELMFDLLTDVQVAEQSGDLSIVEDARGNIQAALDSITYTIYTII